jgi:indolepyruvate ferredoxin oxidoreductase beta subunit
MSAPIRILISALGGEGGGVLASWLADAAMADGYVAQRTSVPGVAQRTGSTTYYVEMLRAEGRTPVLSLAPTAGEVDLFIATELLEAGRLIQAGFVTPDRTTIIAPLRRVYAITEKIAMSDGRADSDLIVEAAKRFSKAHHIGDFQAVADKAKALLNAVIFGLACRALPLSPEACRTAIKLDGRAVEANLRGFEAGLAYDGDEAPVEAPAAEPAPSVFDAKIDAMIDGLPQEARLHARVGVERLVDFQDGAYARLYLERLERFAAMGGADGAFVSELARHLAVRMSSEDVVRVAQLKLREARLARVRAEARARQGDIVRVTEFLKPGPDEFLSILPAPLARALLGLVRLVGLERASIPMRVHTTGLWGFLRLRALASMRGLRPMSLRAAQEKAWIEGWLNLVEQALQKDPAAAREVVETAQLVRGYGDTWARGHANWRRIAEEVIAPMLGGAQNAAHFADAVLQARLAAVADPEGKRLDAMIASLKQVAAPAAT